MKRDAMAQLLYFFTRLRRSLRSWMAPETPASFMSPSLAVMAFTRAPESRMPA